jgi:hypothetical protein
VHVIKKDGFTKAEFDLKVANEKVYLAELKSDLPARHKKICWLRIRTGRKYSKISDSRLSSGENRSNNKL